VASGCGLFRLRFYDEPLPSRSLKLDLPMATIAEVEKLALDLPETERAALAAHLLGSLPSVLHDEDEGIAEALRRDAEFEANPSLGMTLEELDQRIENRRS
jgi:putative addiction module component (TIGR02574 family)